MKTNLKINPLKTVDKKHKTDFLSFRKVKTINFLSSNNLISITHVPMNK